MRLTPNSSIRRLGLAAAAPSTASITGWILSVAVSASPRISRLTVAEWPSAEIWPWIVVISACGTFSHYCMARAMTHADATIVIPMDFLRVPASALLGYLLYREMLDVWTVAGAILILFGNALNLRNAAPKRAAAVSS